MKYRFLRFPGGKTKAVTLSYDDGCIHDLRFSDVISSYGLKCTFNLNNFENRSDSLTDEQINEYFLKRGHEIALHTASHKAPGALKTSEGIREVLENRIEFEKRFGMIIRGMAYPDWGVKRFSNGLTYDDVKKYLTELDIAYARSLGGDNNSFDIPVDWHAWMPTAHHGNPKLMEYIDEFLNLDFSPSYGIVPRPSRLFYIWGHSFEFDKNNNWNLLDEFCSKLAGHDDIWYATNMEIYEYVNAYNSLVVSADSSMIYNPTLYEIWMDIGTEIHKIAPGQTLKLEN